MRTPVSVHYDPADPSQAVLDVDLPGNLVFQIFLGLGIAALGVELLRYHWDASGALTNQR